MWSLVAEDTREGEAYLRRRHKVEEQRKALGGQVFDVLGQAFRGQPLRDLLIEAIRYGDDPARRADLDRVIDERVGEGLVDLVREHGLAQGVLADFDLDSLRQQMEEAE